MDPVTTRESVDLSPLFKEGGKSSSSAKKISDSSSKSDQEAIAATINPGMPVLFSPQNLLTSGNLAGDIKVGLSSSKTELPDQKSNVADAEKILSSWAKNLEEIKSQIEDEKTKTFASVVSSFKELFSQVDDKLELPVTLTLLMITPIGTSVAQTKVSEDQPQTLTQMANIDPLIQASKQDLRDYASYLASFLLTYAIQQTTLPLAEAAKKTPSSTLIATAANDIAKKILLMTSESSNDLQTPFLPLFIEKLDPKDKESSRRQDKALPTSYSSLPGLHFRNSADHLSRIQRPPLRRSPRRRYQTTRTTRRPL